MKNGNQPAFAGSQMANRDTDLAGLTKREYFAARAMQSYIIKMKGTATSDEKIAAWSYEMADAMLKAREAE